MGSSLPSGTSSPAPRGSILTVCSGRDRHGKPSPPTERCLDRLTVSLGPPGRTAASSPVGGPRRPVHRCPRWGDRCAASNRRGSQRGQSTRLLPPRTTIIPPPGENTSHPEVETEDDNRLPYTRESTVGRVLLLASLRSAWPASSLRVDTCSSSRCRSRSSHSGLTGSTEATMANPTSPATATANSGCPASSRTAG